MDMIDKKTWKEFRETGLLCWINRILHTFGWAIVFDFDDGEITEVYPARIKFRGFDDKTESDMFVKLTSHLQDNIEELVKESKL